MKVSASLGGVRVDLDGYRKALKRALATAIVQAASEWLFHVSDAVPSWTGASRATMQHLALKAGFHVDMAITNERGVDRTGLGLSNSTGDVLLDKADEGIVSFHYSTTLAHLIWNEFNNAMLVPDPTKFYTIRGEEKDYTNPALRKPGPYHFQEAGAKAVQQVFDRVELPNPADFIKRSKQMKV